MTKGHLEFHEILFVTLLVVGLAVGVYVALSVQNGSTPQPTQELQTQPNVTAPANVSNAVNENASAGPITQPAPESSVDNRTLGELLDDGMTRADTLFYQSAPSGEVTMDTNRWYVGDLAQPPDSVALKANDLRTADVRFNQRYDSTLRAFAFRIFSVNDSASPPRIYATAVFFSNSSILDPYMANSSGVQVYYGDYPKGAQYLDGCKVLARNESISEAGNAFLVYDLSCIDMYSVNN